MRWGERTLNVQPPGSHVTLAPNCPPHGVHGAADSFRPPAQPRGDTRARESGTKGPSLQSGSPRLKPVSRWPWGGPALPRGSLSLCPSHFVFAVKAYLFLRLPRSLRKSLKTCLVLLGK